MPRRRLVLQMPEPTYLRVQSLLAASPHDEAGVLIQHALAAYEVALMTEDEGGRVVLERANGERRELRLREEVSDA